MKTVTVSEFRRNSTVLLRRIAKGERITLVYRGKAAATLAPIVDKPSVAYSEDDPFFTVSERATPSPKGKLDHRDIDRVLYGQA